LKTRGNYHRMKSQMKKLLVTVVFSICLTGFARADLAKRIDAIINQPSQKKVRFSVHIVKADTGKTIYSHNANKPLVPASNMKIIITAAALEFLGPDYEFKTQVGLCGDALIVIGSGDPLLGDKITDVKYGRKTNWIFEDITAVLKKNNTKTIKDIIVDSSIFDDERVHPNWPAEQLNKWYACEVCGLNYNGNCIDIAAKNTGGKVTVFVEPKTDYVKITNKVKPISKGASIIGSYRKQEINKIVVHGKCRKQIEPFAVAIERPAAFFGFLLAHSLNKAGINVQGQLIEKELDSNCNFKELAEYNTPLADCLARCNKNSFGLAAEALLKTIAANTNPYKKNGSWTEGQKAVSHYLRSIGIDKKEFFIDDGSGLSRDNKLSANAVTTVLLYIYKSKNRQLFKDSLAVGGVDGTIAKYFKEEKYKGRIFGKTGYIGGVKSFSGICATDEGDYIFSILTNNNFKSRKPINDIAKAIFEN